jgi:hypothetical protein
MQIRGRDAKVSKNGIAITQALYSTLSSGALVSSCYSRLVGRNDVTS